MPITESQLVFQGRCSLQEIPDFANGVVVYNGSIPLSINNANFNQLPTTTTVSIDYNFGYVYADPTFEGVTLTFTYHGSGMSAISANRVFTKNNGNTVTQTLQDIVGAGVGSWAFKNIYDNTTSYTANNVVVWNGNAYICIINSLGNLPSNTTYWEIFVASGSVSSVTSANTDIAITNTTSSPNLTLNSANSGANKILKLDGSGNASADILIDGTTNKAYTATEKTKLSGVATNANNYVHPNHTGDVTSTGDGITAIATNVIVNADINTAAAIDATKIANGLVSNTEFQYLDGVTSDIQTQITARANEIGILSNLTTTDKSSLVNSSIEETSRRKDIGYNVKDYNVSGSSQTTTGSITAGQPTLTLATSLDFKNSQGIAVIHAGAACTLSTPTTPTVTPTGTTGSTTYQYQIVALDAGGGCTAAGTVGTTSTGNATLSATNYNVLSWSAVTNAVAYAIYGRVSGTMNLLAIVTVTTFSDLGSAAITPPSTLPTTPPLATLADSLITIISSGAGTTTLILATNATTTATSQIISHDDTVAIQAAINAANTAGGGTVFLPIGSYIVGDLLMKNNVILYAFPNPIVYASMSAPVMLRARTGATYILNVSGVNGFGVYGIMFDGNNTVSAGMSSNCGGGWIENCAFINCSTGVGKFVTAYMHTMLITKCHFHHNTSGIENMIDSKITECFFYSNNVGINFGSGCNANIIANNKVEWNYINGVILYLSANCVINGNIFDRNGYAGLKIDTSDHITVGGSNVFIRNGALITGDQDAHIYAINSTNLSFTGYMSRASHINDDGSGVIKPTNGVTLSGCTDVVFQGCDLTGYVTNIFNIPVGNTRTNYRYNNGTWVRGLLTANGTGSQTAFTFTHGLPAAPSRFDVDPATADACGDHYITVDGTGIYVTFKTAPPSGTGNIVMRINAEI